MISCASCSRQLPNSAQNCPCGWERNPFAEPEPVAKAAHRAFVKREDWHGPTEASRAALESILRTAKPSTRPGKQWAKRILDKHRGGGTVSPLALEYALQVAGDAPAPRAAEPVETDLDRMREAMEPFEGDHAA